MVARRVAIWKSAPFIRFLAPLMVGIVLQWYCQFSLQIVWYAFAFSTLITFVSFLLSGFARFRLSVVTGLGIVIIFISLGTLLVRYKDIRHDKNWLGNIYHRGDLVLAVLKESPVEKQNSFKALASVVAVVGCNERERVTGYVIIYFKKDTSLPPMDVGSPVIFRTELQEIKSSGNPGGFDYKRYSLFQGITHQVYLEAGHFIVLKENKESFPENFLVPIRRKVLSILRRYIAAEKERGLAEALLIGYKDDLDKNLVQSYTNTGVVHIIAISGMHLGLIYWLLVQVLKPFNKKKISKYFAPVIIITGLWLFSLVAGAQPSVLRSALMFTCIVLAKYLSRRTSIYNSLASSAFLLLCFNPYWLWDVGFQLSYAAVLSIVIFMKPVYNWFYIKNKGLDFVWKLNAVSIAAQLLTTPFSIFHFHQFPNYFLLTNFVAVPLSSIIVLGELFLCALSFLPFLASLVGKTLLWLIWIMNSYIERIESLPYSLWEGMQINVVQAGLLIIAVAAFGYWFLDKQRSGAWAGLFALLLFVAFRSASFWQASQQKKFIVYNVPREQAIDVIDGRDYFFIGDSDLLANDLVTNFHVKPCRIMHRVHPRDQLPGFLREKSYLQLGTKRILLLNRNIVLDSSPTRIPIDLLVISGHSKISLSGVSKIFTIGRVVFDSSVPTRKMKYWKKDCNSLRIPYYDVSEKGAFVMNLN
jgi:competence protein ComEC